MNHFQDYIRNYTFSSLLYWRTTHKYIWKERHSDFPVSLLLSLFVCRLHSIRLPLKTLGHNLQAPYVEDSFPISPVGLISPICLLTALKPCQISNSFGINHKGCFIQLGPKTAIMQREGSPDLEVQSSVTALAKYHISISPQKGSGQLDLSHPEHSRVLSAQ